MKSGISYVSYKDFHIYRAFREITMKTFNLRSFSSRVTDTLHSITSENSYVYYKYQGNNNLVQYRQKTIYGISKITNCDRLRHHKRIMFYVFRDYKLQKNRKSKLSAFRNFKTRRT